MARFTERATGQEIVAACRLFERMKSCLQAGDVEGLVNYDVLFHRYYTARCGNERLSEMFGTSFRRCGASAGRSCSWARRRWRS